MPAHHQTTPVTATPVESLAAIDEASACRICDAFAEMPGLRLTERQAALLWHLDVEHCQLLLQALIDAKRLLRTSDGRYMVHPDASPHR